MHSLFRYTVSSILLLSALVIRPSLAQGQSMDMIRQQLMQQGGQTTEPTGNIPSLQGDTGTLRPSDAMPQGFQQTLPPQSDILLDQPVDPDTYTIGPGDLFGVYLWGSIETSYFLRISPEGYLLIPTVGSIKIADMTISEATRRFSELVSENYDDLEVSLFLVEPRRFRLRVSGLVYVPGMHESHALERVSDVLERAGLILPGRENLQDIGENQQINVSSPPGAAISVSTEPGQEQATMPDITVQRRQHAIGRSNPTMLGRSGNDVGASAMQSYPVFTLGENRGSSSRTILIHRNETVLKADLLQFLTTGDLTVNPYVQSGDHIEVLPYAGDIGVYGEVNDEGFYEFKQGDRVSDLIMFGGGLTALADSSQAELVRFDADGKTLIRSTIDLADALWGNPDSPAYHLDKADRLYIRGRVEYKTYRDVSIGGEIRYEGVYPIEKDGTTLTELVSMAGGFTGHENLGEARLIRRTDFAAADHEYERINQLLAADRTYQENQYLVSYMRTFAGSINIDFEKLFDEHDLSYDVVLRDGDIIYIPLKRHMVNVMGAVMDPGYFAVEEGEGYKFYLEKAGGLNWNGDKRNVFVYKADTGQNYNVRYRDVPIEGGDTVFVMERARRNFWSYFREYSGYVTTVATIALIALQASN